MKEKGHFDILSVNTGDLESLVGTFTEECSDFLKTLGEVNNKKIRSGVGGRFRKLHLRDM